MNESDLNYIKYYFKIKFELNLVYLISFNVFPSVLLLFNNNFRTCSCILIIISMKMIFQDESDYSFEHQKS